MKQGHLTEQRKHFVEAYCRLGNGTLAAKEAGYKDSPSLVNQASKLKRELSAEISEELRSSFMNAAPKALSILMDLAENSASDSVKFQASKDLLDSAGFRPFDRYGAETPLLGIPPPECMVTASEVASAWATSKIRRESIKNGSNRKNLKLKLPENDIRQRHH